MAIEIFDAPLLGNRFIEHSGVDENGQFTYPVDEEIDTGDLLNLVEYHRDHLRKKFLRDRKYYKGHHAIEDQPAKPEYKPDNRIILNFPRKVVTTYNGFFIGNPIKVDYPDDKQVDDFVAKWVNSNGFDLVASEVSKQSAMYGHAFFLVYQSEVNINAGETPTAKLAPIEPLNAFVIYDDTFAHEPKYGVIYRRNYKHETEITLWDSKYKREFVTNSSANTWLTQIRVTANPYQMVPLIEVDENSERMAICDDIVSLIDALDKAMSNKANDSDYFADAILKVIGPSMNKKDMDSMRDNRLLSIRGEASNKADAEFMGKPDSDQSQEHLLDRLVQSIYEIANITNLNDDAFNGSPSGVALKLKYQAMDNMARAKTFKFREALRQVFRCVFAVSFHNVPADAWNQLEFKFTRTIPVNLLEESQAAVNLKDTVSRRTLLGSLSIVDDPDAELEQIKKEQKEAQASAQNTMQQALAASQTDQQKAGVVNNDLSQARESQNQPNTGGGQQTKPSAG